MKNKVLSLSIFSIIILFTSCANALTGATETTLKKTVSIEQNCPIDSIKILSQARNTAHGTFELEVCGKRMVYKQLGTGFFESKQADEVLETFKNPKK